MLNAWLAQRRRLRATVVGAQQVDRQVHEIPGQIGLAARQHEHSASALLEWVGT
jgi:hypothetical protein